MTKSRKGGVREQKSHKRRTIKGCLISGGAHFLRCVVCTSNEQNDQIFDDQIITRRVVMAEDEKDSRGAGSY